jgi:hypothetical protein
MRTTLVIGFCCLSLIAVVLDLLVFRPFPSQVVQSPGPRWIVTVTEIPLVPHDNKGRTGLEPMTGDAVGFSCLLDKDGTPQCYMATRSR